MFQNSVDLHGYEVGTLSQGVHRCLGFSLFRKTQWVSTLWGKHNPWKASAFPFHHRKRCVEVVEIGIGEAHTYGSDVVSIMVGWIAGDGD